MKTALSLVLALAAPAALAEPLLVPKPQAARARTPTLRPAPTAFRRSVRKTPLPSRRMALAHGDGSRAAAIACEAAAAVGDGLPPSAEGGDF
jgi:hypothetical protein